MNDSLRVVITDPHLDGGGQVRYIANLSRELVRAGHRVTIGCRPNSVLIQTANEAGCAVLPNFAFRGGLRPRAWSADIRTLQHVLRDSPPDVLHVNLSQDHWTAAAANRLLGSPVCVLRTRHNTYPVKDSRANRVLNRRWTDYQIVVCDSVRQTLAAQPTFDAARLCAIHNGVNAEAFRPDSAARTQARREFAYTDDHLVLGIAARLVPAKGHEFLFRAVAQLRDQLPHLRVLVLGQGELDHYLRPLAAYLGIQHMVHFAGFRNDMPRCTQAFDIGVQPSIDCDTSSFSLKEQMAAEKPVIASDYGGLTEIVTDGVEGLVVAQGTVEPLADAIGTLAHNAELRQTMGAAGRQRVLRDFTVQIFAHRTIEAYRNALRFHSERKRR